MAISNFVTDALDLLKAGRDETAMLTITSAVDASAKHQYKHLENVGDRFRTFFDDNLCDIYDCWNRRQNDWTHLCAWGVW